MKFSLSVSVALAASALAATNSTYLQATALITNAQNNSALQCWQFKAPAAVSSDAGTSGSATFAFPQTNETIYTVIPPRFDGGTHKAPKAQLVVFLSGLAHITLPHGCGNSSVDEAWITGGANGLLLALDTTGTGHVTKYPSDQATVSLQIPWESEDAVPEHEIVNDGPCRFESGHGQLVQ